MRRIGAISVLVKMGSSSIERVNALLSEFADIVVARLDVPYRERGLHVLTLVIEGTSDDVGALTGRLGSLKDVRVRSLLI